MTNRLANVLCSVALLISFYDAGLAQEPPSRTAKSPSLEDALSEFATLDDSMQKHAAAFLAVVETEASAKRISKLEAEELRWTVHSISSPVNGDPKVLLANANVRGENEVLIKAVDEFTSLAEGVSDRKDALLSQAIGEMRTRIAEVVARSGRSEEVGPLTRLVRKLVSEARTHASLRTMESKTRTFADGVTLLETFSATLDAITRNDASAAEAGVRELTALSRSTLESASSDAAVRQIRAIQAPLLASVVKAQDALQSALVGRARGAEIADALGKLDEALRAYTPVGFSPKLRIYRALAAVATEGEKPDVAGRTKALEQARSALVSTTLEEPRKAALQEILAQWETNKPATPKGGEPILKSLAARVEEATKPSDLEALALELRSANPGTRPSKRRFLDSEPPDPAQLASSLSGMAAAWSAGNLDFMNSFTAFDGSDSPGISKGLKELRLRILRDILSRTLNSPELNEPPLASQPLDNALIDLANTLAAKGEWRAVLKIFDIQSPGDRNGEEKLPFSDSAASVRLFLAGQNLELAGEWQSAAHAYKRVLQTAAEVSPIKESVARLKSLKKEHPKAFDPPLPHVRDAFSD